MGIQVQNDKTLYNLLWKHSINNWITGRIGVNEGEMNIQNIVREIRRTNEDEKRRIKDRMNRAIEEVEKLKVDFLKISGVKSL